MNQTLYIQSTGKIISIQDNIVVASGLNNAFLGEVVKFKTLESEILGQILNLERTQIRIALIKGKQSELTSGDIIYRTNKDVQTKVGFGVLGKLTSALGDIINVEDFQLPELVFSDLVHTEFAAVEKNAPGIISRETVRQPFLTGINSVDCFIPIGCGQRELIIGDHGTGKTSLAITAIINQKKVNNEVNAPWRNVENLDLGSSVLYKHSSFIPCIYVGIGQKRSEIARIKKLLELANSMNFCNLIFTSSDEPASIQFLAPYSGSAVGEWFRDRGYKSIVVFDDLSQHAVAYRQMSLLLRRPPGREAYPGDIFYVHSRLLERAAQLHRNIGGGALTALPIITTKGGDISAYIPTNVISITDGQVFLSSDLANKGMRPAVNIGLSVSRVGSSAQTLLMRELNRKLKANYAYYTQYKGIDKLGGEVDPVIAAHIQRGLRIDEFFKQDLYQPTSYLHQVLTVYLLINGHLDNVDIKYQKLFLQLLFNGSFAEQYVTNKNYNIINIFNNIESWLYSNVFNNSKLLSNDITDFFNNAVTFFVQDIQPRLVKDTNNSVLNALKTKIKK